MIVKEELEDYGRVTIIGVLMLITIMLIAGCVKLMGS